MLSMTTESAGCVSASAAWAAGYANPCASNNAEDLGQNQIAQSQLTMKAMSGSGEADWSTAAFRALNRMVWTL
jgi:hypothetical protein